MMRIDPRLSLVWRTPDTVQIGFPVAVVAAKLTPAQEHLLVALRAGANDSALYGLAKTRGISREDCAAFVEVLRPAFEPPHTPRVRVGVDGHGAAAEAIVRLLSSTCDVRWVNAASVAHERLSPDRRIPSAARARAEREGQPWRPDLVVVIATFAISQARCGVWLRREIPHLGVVIGDSVSRVGPLVHAGVGPCLSCVEMQAADADPSRAAMLSQLHGKPSGGENTLVSAELATVVTRVASLGLAVGEVLELDAATGLWTSESISTCLRCSCRALPRIEKPAVA
jgi:hypothetical protein